MQNLWLIIFRQQIKENLLSQLIPRNAKFLQGNAIIIITKIWAEQFRISSKQYDTTRALSRAQ